jgi:hypothetical protein
MFVGGWVYACMHACEVVVWEHAFPSVSVCAYVRVSQTLVMISRGSYLHPRSNPPLRHMAPMRLGFLPFKAGSIQLCSGGGCWLTMCKPAHAPQCRGMHSLGIKRTMVTGTPSALRKGGPMDRSYPGGSGCADIAEVENARRGWNS